VRSHGIAVNAVLPSTMDTPQNRAAMPNANFASWLQLSDVAKVLAQLISSESGPINGQAIRL
jgi:NAD(P)-dependent dehydrogenase (short-subunit alcohol dehydrogenase family)